MFDAQLLWVEQERQVHRRRGRSPLLLPRVGGGIIPRRGGQALGPIVNNRGPRVPGRGIRNALVHLTLPPLQLSEAVASVGDVGEGFVRSSLSLLVDPQDSRMVVLVPVAD